MKKFRFKFETVERLRKQKEDEALREFSRMQMRFRDEVNKRQNLLEILDEALERRSMLGKQPSPPSVFHVEDNFIKGTKVQIELQEKAIERARRALEVALDQYRVARQKKKVVDHLRDKETLKYRKEKKKNERLGDDDLMLMRARVKKDQEVS